MENTQTCTKCGDTKLISDFARDNYKPTGYRKRCKECLKQYAHDWYATHKEHVKKTNATYKAAHKEEVNAYNKAYRLNAPGGPLEYDRIRREKRRDQRIAYGRERYAANPVAARERAREWYWKNVDRARENTRTWRRDNMIAVLAYNRNRAAYIRKVEGTHSPQDIMIIYECQKGVCAYCGIVLGLSYSVDHMIPVTKGGSNYPFNLCITCKKCNSSKKDKTAGEFFVYLRIKKRKMQA